MPVRAIAYVWRATGDRARIWRAYPSLSPEDVDQAIGHYEMHRDEIDADLLDEQGEED